MEWRWAARPQNVEAGAAWEGAWEPAQGQTLLVRDLLGTGALLGWHPMASSHPLDLLQLHKEVLLGSTQCVWLSRTNKGAHSLHELHGPRGRYEDMVQLLQRNLSGVEIGSACNEPWAVPSSGDGACRISWEALRGHARRPDASPAWLRVEA